MYYTGQRIWIWARCGSSGVSFILNTCICKIIIIDEFWQNYPTCQVTFLFIHSDNVTWLFIQSEESSLCACNGKSMTKKSSYEHRRFQLDCDWSKCNYIVFSYSGSMLQLLSNSITIFLFDALKQTESMLNVPNEWVMENVCFHII